MPLIRKHSGKPSAVPTGPHSPGSRLTSGTAEERWAAARALADDPSGANALAVALPGEPEARVREAILTSLIRHGEAGVGAVLPLVRSDDAKLRTEALDALRAMPAAMQPYLQELLADPDADVRLLACDLARVLPGAEASRMLCELLDRESEVNVCGAAIDTLAEVGGPDALAALARCGERFANEPFLDFAIRAASQAIGAEG